MIEELLKNLGKEGYYISSHYEWPTNSIILKIRKDMYTVCQVIEMSELPNIFSLESSYEFAVTQVLGSMVAKLKKMEESSYAEN